MLLAIEWVLSGMAPPGYSVRASLQSSSTLPLFQRTSLSNSPARKVSLRFNFFFLPPRISGCRRNTHLPKRKCNFQALISCSKVFGVAQCLITAVNAFATATRHCCGILFTVGIDVAKMSIKLGSKQVGLTMSSTFDSSTNDSIPSGGSETQGAEAAVFM